MHLQESDRARGVPVWERLLFPSIRLIPGPRQDTFAGRSILITGASFGIGRALAEQLAASGAHLLLVARTGSALDEVRRKVREVGGQADWMAADLRAPEEMDAVLDWLHRFPRGPQVLVHNAGHSIRRGLAQSEDRFHDVTRTNAINFLAPVRLTLALLPRLRESGGQILNVSAASVLLPPLPGWSAYQASKCAFDQWLRCNRRDLACMGVESSTAYLPLVRTRMNERPRWRPAMEPEQAALRLRRLLERGTGNWAPWWFPAAAWASRLVPRAAWERLG